VKFSFIGADTPRPDLISHRDEVFSREPSAEINWTEIGGDGHSGGILTSGHSRISTQLFAAPAGRRRLFVKLISLFWHIDSLKKTR